MLKIMNIDGQIIGMTAHENKLEELASDCLQILIENEEIFEEDYPIESSLEIILDNGYILNNNGILTANENTLKYYFSSLV